MPSLNRTELIGHLGADPESRAMPSGGAVVTLRLATSESWKDKTTGEKKERTEWHRVVYFGRLAEICSEYLRKGSLIRVVGSLRTRKWQDKNGQDRYTTEVNGAELMMLDGKPQRTGQQTNSKPPAQTNAKPSQPETDPGFDDDIPFGWVALIPLGALFAHHALRMMA